MSVAEQKGRTKMGEEKAGGAARGYPEVARVLVAARMKVASGWVQRKYMTRVNGRPVAWCATGAIDDVVEHPDDGPCLACEARAALRAAIAPAGTETWRQDVPVWNDEPGRTQAEVLAAFDRAIELASTASAPKEPPDPPEGPEAPNAR